MFLLVVILFFEAGEFADAPNIWLEQLVCFVNQTCPPIGNRCFVYFSLILMTRLEKPDLIIYCHYLPVSGLGNLRACCLPWMW